jgi:integrating conjugative element protein (TIGR03752 family)
MKSNILLKVVAVSVVLAMVLVLVVGKRSGGGGSNSASNAGLVAVETGPAGEFNGLDEGLMGEEEISAEYGVDVDSPVETMRTLTSETQAVREENDRIVKENEELKRDLDRLLRMEETINKRLDQRLERTTREQEDERKQLERDQDSVRKLISRVEQKLSKRLESVQGSTEGGKPTAASYSINEAGIPSGLGYDESGNAIDYDEVVWIDPVDAQGTDRNGEMSLPKFSDLANPVKDATKTLPGQKKRNKEERLIKAYTIPENATLMGSVSMTALLGRIPIGGRVQDPYPFKLIVGEENLSSNGIEIPNVVGIKMTGVAKGDWTLSCTSGQIYSMTFTFRDGTILTIPEPGTKSSEPLAWFSDINGIPCITGKRITNAVSYLTSRVGLSAASSYAKARADSEYTTSVSTGVNGTNSSRTLTGDPMTIAENTAISDGIDEVSDWLDARQANSFDAIYVPPGTPLAIHITEELKIDYDPEGRKVNHYANLEPRSRDHID